MTASTGASRVHDSGARVRHVCLCADANFVVPLAVTLRSITESQASLETLQITVGSFEISTEDQDRVKASVRPLRVEFVPLEDQVPVDVPSKCAPQPSGVWD